MKKFEYPENATPINDISGLKLDWVQNQQDLNRAEAENISKAQRKYLRKTINNPSEWFEPVTLRKIHQDMFSDVWNWAGNYRQQETTIGVNCMHISSKLAELCDNVRGWNIDVSELTFLEQAARIHHKLVLIHPFPNGNGRFSRLVADRYLSFWGCPHPQWPAQLQQEGESLRNEYIECLRRADGKDYNPLITFMRKLGAQDPALSKLLGLSIYKDKLNNAQRIALVKAFLRMGHKVNETENNGNHPLHIAIKRGFEEIVLLLIEHKADLKFRDQTGFDPFELAISINNFKIAKALINAGYPYKRGQITPTKLLNYHANLYAFDMQLH